MRDDNANQKLFALSISLEFSAHEKKNLFMSTCRDYSSSLSIIFEYYRMKHLKQSWLQFFFGQRKRRGGTDLLISSHCAGHLLITPLKMQYSSYKTGL